MSLTVKEKEHWKERIGKRIDAAVERLKLSDAADELKKLEDDAVKEAERSLGLDELIERFHELTDRKKQLNERQEAVLVDMRKQLGSSDSHHGYFGDELPRWILTKVEQRAELYRLPLLEGSESGRKLLNLERKKEELLDAVWLSTSLVQIKQLWAQVAVLLKFEQTDLQKKAAEIEPVSADS